MEKENIIKTRTGGFGSSDAKMIATIGKKGSLSQTANKRIALMLGLIQKDEFTTSAIRLGNHIEDAIFNSLKGRAENAISNPYYKSKKLSKRYGFDVINHIDIEMETENQLVWYEIKATIKDIEETYEEYKYQLAWHYMLLNERCKGKKEILQLVHYNTSNSINSFDINNVSIKKVNFSDIQNLIDEILEGLLIISTILPNFQYQTAEIGCELLPKETKELLPKIYNLLNIAKEAEEQANKFKEQLKDSMQKYGIMAIDNEYFKAVFMPESSQDRFDTKTLKVDQPDIYSKYIKKTKVNSSIRLTLK